MIFFLPSTCSFLNCSNKLVQIVWLYHGSFCTKQHLIVTSTRPHHFFTTSKYLKPCTHSRTMALIGTPFSHFVHMRKNCHIHMTLISELANWMDSVEHCANSFTSVLFCELWMIAHTTPYISFSCIMEDVCRGIVYWTVYPTLFSYFVPICYPYIVLHFKCLTLLILIPLTVILVLFVMQISCHSSSPTLRNRERFQYYYQVQRWREHAKSWGAEVLSS